MDLTDADLLAYLNGDLDEQTENLEITDEIQARLDELAHVQKRLSARLHRIECPQTAELGEYYLHNLSPSQRLLIAAHLRTCLRCREELEELQDYLGSGSGLVEKLRMVLARRLSPGADLLAAGAPSGVRGDDAEIHQFEAEGVQITLQFETDPAQPGRRVAMGLIMGMEPAATRVLLWRENELATSARVDELGNFVVDDLEPGEYELAIRGPQQELQIQSVQI